MASTCVLIDLRRLAADCGVPMAKVAAYLGISKQLLHNTYLDAPDLQDADALKIAGAIYMISASRYDTAAKALAEMRD